MKKYRSQLLVDETEAGPLFRAIDDLPILAQMQIAANLMIGKHSEDSEDNEMRMTITILLRVIDVLERHPSAANLRLDP